MKKIVETLGVLEVIVAIAGIVCYFTGNVMITYFCAAFSLLHSFLNVLFGDQNGFGSELLTILIGIAVAFIFKLNTLGVVSVAVCIGSVVFFLIPLLLVGAFSRK